MTQYQFYFTDELGHVFGRNAYAAKDDLEALKLAEKLHPDFGIQIWDGDRLVAHLKKDGTASTDHAEHAAEGTVLRFTPRGPAAA